MGPKRAKACTEPSQGSKKRSRRVWSDVEIRQVLDFMKNTIQTGGKIEKPNARAYYHNMADSLGLEHCNSVSIINKMAGLKGTYDKALKWRGATGQGVDEQTVKEKLHELCPFFDEMDEIYSERVSMHPPYVMESDATGTENEEAGEGGSGDEAITVPPSPHSSEECNDSRQSPSPPPTKKVKQSPKNSEYSLIISTRQEIQREEIAVESRKIDLDRQRVQIEQEFKKEQMALEKRRLEHEVVSRIDSFDFKREQLNFEREKLEREHDLEKFRIEQNVKLQIELAKINKN